MQSAINASASTNLHVLDKARTGCRAAALALLVFLSPLTGLAQKASQHQGSAGSQKHRATPPAVLVATPVEVAPPPPPPTPEQMPPAAPQVAWDGEQLTIASDNSTLADILVAVRELTGADIDIPSGASAERVAARLGPGPAREILASLLGGTDFNYVIQAADNNPLGLQSIVLTPRSRTGTPGGKAAIMTAMQRPDRSRSAEPGSLPAAEKPEVSSEPPASADKHAPESGAGIDAQHASLATPSTSGDAKPAGTDAQSSALEPLPVQADLTPPPTPPQADPNRPKTIEDKIQEMQSLFEQRRQMIEQSRKPAN